MRKSRLAAATLALLTGLSLAACGGDGGSTPTAGADLDLDAYNAIIDGGKTASEDVIAASEWATSVKNAGVLRIGGTETSNLFSLLNPAEGKVVGFDAGIGQLLATYILGEANTEVTQVSVDTRESLIESGDVDATIATYSITPERAERISFAGPYYQDQFSILVTAANDDIKSVDDLDGKIVATQANSTGETVIAEFAPGAEILPLPEHAQAVEAVKNGNADAYIVNYGLLLNAALQEAGAVKTVGEPFGPADLYGIGVPLDSDAVEFINGFLKEIIEDGTWDKLWQVTIGDRTGVSEAPAAPTPGDTGL
ncbi:amino acid ABC transporter substrate-binding protein, PAAT family [Ruaniaceae bacterium KH17]|nr:amino acid ABC transporter substrate-binding protein, PAAT family [Ruaniaceae bacterium KH17]